MTSSTQARYRSMSKERLRAMLACSKCAKAREIAGILIYIRKCTMQPADRGIAQAGQLQQGLRLGKERRFSSRLSELGQTEERQRLQSGRLEDRLEGGLGLVEPSERLKTLRTRDLYD